ncbi:MAG: tRNA lysidine(34) synthetase TilS [Phycisphaerae bacterium]
MPPPRGLIQQLDQHLHRSELLPPRARLLVAVSGGADSVALLRLLHVINQSDHWQWRLLVGHVDHGIRGKTSTDDARFVKSLAKSFAIPCIQKKLRLGRKTSEALARTARLAALEKMAVQKKCDAMVLGHHADDQAETVLLRLVRGAGLDGLAGMAEITPMLKVPIVRPLLKIRRAALRKYLADVQQPWREDESNASDAYLRNRVRGQLMPVLEHLAPAAVDAIGRTAQIAGETQDLLESLAFDLLNEAVIAITAARIELQRNLLQLAPPIVCAELMRQILLHMGGSTETTDFERTREAVRIVQASAGGKSIQLGRGLLLRAGGGVVRVEKSR